MMSGTETGVMTREPFGGVTPQPVIQNMRLAYSGDGAAVYKPMSNNNSNSNSNTTTSPSYQTSPYGGGGEGGSGSHVNMGSGSEMMKKKRGRPRKYGPDGSMALALASAPHSVTITQPGSAGFGFIPHVITVKAGEDVSSKIMSFSQHGPRAICILSANGAISNVTLRQPATSGGTVTYEGRFEILSLSGSFLPSESGGQRSRIGGLSVSLSGPDGRVLGGGVAGLLLAASPVQVVVASFISDGRKESKSPNHHIEPLSAINRLAHAVGTTGPSSPPSRGTLSESSAGPGSPLNQSTGACNNNNNLQGISGMPWK